MADIIKAMQADGWYAEYPLIWDTSYNRKIKEKSKYIIAGNHRVKCALDAGIFVNNCIVIIDSNYDWKKAHEDCIALNHRKGRFNEEKLKDFIDNFISRFNVDVETFSSQVSMDSAEVQSLLNGFFLEDKIKEQELDEKTIPVKHECPKCGYKWS